MRASLGESRTAACSRHSMPLDCTSSSSAPEASSLPITPSLEKPQSPTTSSMYQEKPVAPSSSSSVVKPPPVTSSSSLSIQKPIASNTTPVKKERKTKKRKRKGPWDVKIGSVVAVRFSSRNDVSVLNPNDHYKHEKPRPRPLQYPVPSHCDLVEEWLDPLPGVDEGVSLLGRLIRFPPTAMTSNSAAGTAVSKSSATTNKKKTKASSTLSDHDYDSWIDGEVVAVQYPPTKQHADQGVLVVGVLVEESILNSNSGNGANKSGSGEKKRVPVQVTLHGFRSRSNSGGSSGTSAWQIQKSVIVPSSVRIKERRKECEAAATAAAVASTTQSSASTTTDSHNPDENDIATSTDQPEAPTEAQPPPKLDHIYLGDGYDQPREQERNWHWLARWSSVLHPFHPALSSSNSSSSSAAPSSGGVGSLHPPPPPPLVGVVVSMEQSENGEDGPTSGKDSNTTMLLLKKLWIPEHTHEGRMHHHDTLEVFDDADDSNDSSSPVQSPILYCVNLEDVIVISKGLTRCPTDASRQAALESSACQGRSRTGLIVSHLYSAVKKEYFPLRAGKDVCDAKDEDVLAEGVLSCSSSSAAPLHEGLACHGCLRRPPPSSSISSTTPPPTWKRCTASIGPCHNGQTWWCSSCCQPYIQAGTFPSSQPHLHKWKGPCCFGLCECDVCRGEVRLGLSSLMLCADVFASRSRMKEDGGVGLLRNREKCCSTCLYPCAKFASVCEECHGCVHRKCGNWESALLRMLGKKKKESLSDAKEAKNGVNGVKNGSSSASAETSETAKEGKSSEKNGGANSTHTTSSSKREKQESSFRCWRCSVGAEDLIASASSATSSTTPTPPAELSKAKKEVFRQLRIAATYNGPVNFELPNDFLEPLPVPSIKARQLNKRQRQHKRSLSSISGIGKETNIIKHKRARALFSHDHVVGPIIGVACVGQASVSSSTNGLETLDGSILPSSTTTYIPPRLDERYMPKSCSRTIPYSRAVKRSLDEKEPTSSAPNSNTSTNSTEKDVAPPTNEPPRCCRSMTDSATASGRAARANQRRMLKDEAFGSGIMTQVVDTLAGREPRLRFGRSTIHRWGVFVEEDLSAGDMVLEYRGELIGNAVADKREQQYQKEKIGNDYMFRMDATTVCDGTKQGTLSRFLNASCNPNCYTQIINVKGTKRIVIYAKRDICAGDELCYDYKFPLEYDEEKRVKCNCGASNCRGFLNWDKRYVAIPLKPGEGEEAHHL